MIMKKLLIVTFVSLLLAGCGLSDECIQNSGSITTRAVSVAAFENIYVNSGIALVIKEGPEFSVTVEAGANIIDDVEALVSDGNLILTEKTGCNWVRTYAVATVYVTAPNIVEIISNTEMDIKSDGVLHYPLFRLYGLNDFGGVATGNFYMQVDNGQLVVQSNNVSGFYITGKTDQLLLNFYDGTGRFEGAEFLADEIVVFQRGSNDMIVNPVDIIRGDIYGPGNIICKSRPTISNVVEHYTGRLIFD